MAVMVAEQIGPDRILAKNPFGKALVQRDYRHPKTKEIYEYSIFSYKEGKVRPSIFMAITADTKNVIAVRQFREAANEVILEVPGGNPKAGQTAEDVVRAELIEETGYQAGKIINLAPHGPVWIEPSSFSTPMFPFLVTGCVKVAEPKLDKTENMEVEIITLGNWLTMCFDGLIRDNKTLAITFLSLPHIGVSLDYGPQPR